jgi:hypothetical protein
LKHQARTSSWTTTTISIAATATTTTISIAATATTSVGSGTCYSSTIWMKWSGTWEYHSTSSFSPNSFFSKAPWKRKKSSQIVTQTWLHSGHNQQNPFLNDHNISGWLWKVSHEMQVFADLLQHIGAWLLLWCHSKCIWNEELQ